MMYFLKAIIILKILNLLQFYIIKIFKKIFIEITE